MRDDHPAGTAQIDRPDTTSPLIFDQRITTTGPAHSPQRRLLLLTDPRRLRAEPDPSAQIDDAGVRSPATYPTALKSREKNEGMAETGYPPV